WDRLADALAALPDEGPVPVAGPATVSTPASNAGGAKRLAWLAAAVVLAAGAWLMFGADDAREAGADAGRVPAGTTESRSSTIAPSQPAGIAPGPAGAEFAGPGYDPTRASPGAATAPA